MEFQLSARYVEIPGNPEEPRRRVEFWSWTLTSKEGDVCRSPMDYATEKQARAAIAAAKTSMKAARFAKVTLDAIPNAGECD